VLFGRGLAPTSLSGEASGPTDLPCRNFQHAGQFSFIGEFGRSFDRGSARVATHLSAEPRLLARVKLDVETIEEEEAMEQAWIKNT